MTYEAPIEEIEFAMKYIADYDAISSWPSNEDYSWDTARAVVGEGARIATDVFAPLHRKGDLEGAYLKDGKVVLPDGWKEAFDALAEGGWIGLSENPKYGGQGMPNTVSAAVNEMWASANVALALCPLLSLGAFRAIDLNATEELKEIYLPKLLDGSWAGTMNLTEPHAGSDVGSVRTKAVKEGDHYRITGQKIFITYGDHELTENIVHLVLARTLDESAGSKGISLFIVPKYLVGDDGKPGERNDVTCVSLEHKLGIHASPTAVLSYGDNGGAVGYLVGEENRGLEYMFVMMNAARYGTGIQGLALAEGAYQKARAYAFERIQGVPIGHEKGAPIAAHPDVRRMLLSMKSRIDAMRYISFMTSSLGDQASRGASEAERAEAMALYEFLIPIHKGWLTEIGQDVISQGIQIHGGQGYIEETGAAQYYRDNRIAAIYEGTTGIQAADLVFRKTAKEAGRPAQILLERLQAIAKEAPKGIDGANLDIPAFGAALKEAADLVVWACKTSAEKPGRVAAASDGFLRVMGIVLGAGLHIKAAASADAAFKQGEIGEELYRGKVASAAYFLQSQLPEVKALAAAAVSGADGVIGFKDEWF